MQSINQPNINIASDSIVSTHFNDVAIIEMPTVNVVNDKSLGGYHLDLMAETFLRSDVGIAVWSEYDGSCSRVDGRVEARIVQTQYGPAVEISNEEEGLMAPRFRIKCIDLIGLAPASSLEGRIHKYRAMLSLAKISRVMH
jgi:hypothetical protein